MTSKSKMQIAPTPLNEAGLALLGARLHEQLNELDARVQAHKAELGENSSATSNTFVAGADGARADVEGDDVLAQLAVEEAELGATRAAMQRLQQGSYGFCEVCGETIGMARLLAVPQATTCVACQTILEQDTLKSR